MSALFVVCVLRGPTQWSCISALECIAARGNHRIAPGESGSIIRLSRPTGKLLLTARCKRRIRVPSFERRKRSDQPRYQVPSQPQCGRCERAEQGELLLIRVGQVAVRQLAATGRGSV